MCLVVLCCMIAMPVVAQDYLDVPQGFETLNLAVEGDTTATGDPVSENRVYRLERGGFYLLNGAIQNSKGSPFRLEAAEGDGPLPVIIPAADEAGSADRAFKLKTDATLKHIYVSGIDNLGNQAGKNLFRIEKEGGRYVLDGCFFDHDAQSFVRMNSENQKLFIKNTIMRNSILLANPGNGRFIDTRGNTQDTIMVQNSTLYLCSSAAMRDGSGIIRNAIFDHVTIYQAGGELSFEKGLNVMVKNCLMIDQLWEGDIEPSDPAAAMADSLETEIIEIDSLNAPDLMTDAERQFMIKNNVYGWSPEVEAFFAGIDTVQKPFFFNARGERFFATYDNWVAEDNIEAFVEFSDPPPPSNVVTFAQHRHSTKFSDENNPDPRADRNGITALSEDPTSVGPAEDEFDFDYNTDAQAYTFAEGGFPVGDLNWFPGKKAEWEAWIETSVLDRTDKQPSAFNLDQNYPNPFNPSTTIDYRLSRSSQVELAVYNMLGQKIRTLVSDKIQAVGTHSVKWDGRDDSGAQVASGVYIYQLKTGNQVETRKMMLMK